MNGWTPITDPPGEYEDVLLWCPDQDTTCIVGVRYGEVYRTPPGCSEDELNPSHWMPLPSGPGLMTLRGKAKKAGEFSIFVRLTGHNDLQKISVRVRAGQTAGQIAGALREKARRMGALGYIAAKQIGP